MPLVSQTFDQLIDFTRTTAGTFVGSNGLIQNTPASRNLLTFTQEFDNAAWAKNIAATVTANSTTAPDGTLTADKLAETATTAVYNAGRTITTTAVAYTWSCYVKAAERNFALLYHAQTNASLAVNLTTGATGTASGTVAPTSSSVVAVGNGWWRISMTVTATAASNFFGVYIMNDLVSVSYAGTAGSGIFVWGAQLELGSTASDYTRNFGGLFPPRFDYDPVTLAPRGLLIEEQRTNLLVRSEEFDNASWLKSNVAATANTVASPDGTTSADTLTLSNTGGFINQLATVAATSCTFSVFMRKGSDSTFALLVRNNTTATNLCRVTYNFDTGATTVVSGAGSATLTDVGNGWFRATLTVTTGVTSGDGILPYIYPADITGLSGAFAYAWGAQLEAGAFATSYIPTVASQVTRTADAALILAPNFAPWYNQSEGSFVVDFDCSATSSAVTVDDTTNSNFIRVGRINTTGRLRVFTGGVEQVNLGPANAAGWAGPVKQAAAYRADDFAATVNAGAVSTDTSGTLPTVSTMRIGTSGAADAINGHIRSIRYYPVRLSDAQLQALTA